MVKKGFSTEIFDVSVVITTRNRCEDVCRAIESCLAQKGVSLEVLVYDDSSTDNTRMFIRENFPECRLFEGAIGVGPGLDRRGLYRDSRLVNRNRGFLEARAPIVLSLDDDAYFTSHDSVAAVVEYFVRNARLGALALPFVEPRSRVSLSSQRSPFQAQAGDELRNYVACACALRCESAIGAGGYREFYVHQHEERDLCLRIRANGWSIMYGDGAPVVHMVRRDPNSKSVWFFAGRNQFLDEFLNAPFPDVVPRLLLSVVGYIRYRFTFRLLPLKLHALGAGLLACWQHARKRAPVSRAVYRRHRQLPTHGPLPWEGETPAPCARGDVT